MNRRSFFARVFGTAGCIAVNPFKFLGSLSKAKPVVNAFGEPFTKPIPGALGYDLIIKEVKVFDGVTWTRVIEPYNGDWKC